MQTIHLSNKYLSQELSTVAVLRQGIMRLALHDEADRPISKTGRPQKWLIDLRAVLLDPNLLRAAAELFWQTFAEREHFVVGALETAAIPLLAAILLNAPANRASVTGFIIRKERKTTGLGRSIEGTLSDGPIILIDDILNSGGSAETARMTLQRIGRSFTDMFVVIDYQSQRGLTWRRAHDVNVHSPFNLSHFGLSLRDDPPSLRQTYRPIWHVSVPGGFPFHVVPKSAPVLAEGLLYRGCDAGKMQAFDPLTGRVVWEHHATGAAVAKGVWSTPAIHAGHLYYGAYNGVVYCLDAATGQELWSQPACEWIGASPLIVPRHQLIFVGFEYERPWAKGALTALDARTGAKVWEQLVKNFQHGSAAYWAQGDLVVWGSADHAMLALEARTGNVVWSFATRRSVKYAPAIDEQRGLVAFASFDKSIYLLDVATGTKRGEWQTDGICYTTPLFAGSRLFCGSGDRHLYVIDLESLELVKKIDLGARVYASPRLIGERIIVSTAGGRVLEFDRERLTLEGEIRLPDAVTNAVAISPEADRIFVSTYMNDLYAFERISEHPQSALGSNGDPR